MPGKLTPYGHIYLITNTVNGKIYIGQTKKPIKKRFSEHYYDANRKGGTTVRIHNAIRKHGIKNFTIKTICSCYSQQQLNYAEIVFIAAFNSTNSDKGYNIALGGQSSGATGITISEETRQRLRDSHKGKTPSAETRAKMSAAHKGRVFSEESRKKISVALTGKKRNAPPVKHWLGKKRPMQNVVIKTGADSPSAKKTYQYDKSFNLVAVFDAKVLAEQATGIKYIADAVNTDFRKTAGGFYWSYTQRQTK